MMRVKVAGGQITAAATGEPVDNAEWVEASETPKPEDTDEGTWVEGVELTDGVPVQTWTLRPWSESQLANMDPDRLAELEAARKTAELRESARQALTTNVTYLALSPPTAAQVAAQVAALTRQTNVLIRLGLGLLD